MHLRVSLTKLWAYSNVLLATGITLFLLRYIFCRGTSTVSWELLSQPPKRAVLGGEGGIWPATMGSLYFTATAIVLGGIPAVVTALLMVFYYKGRRTAGLVRIIIQCISGIPSIVLGLFAYSFLVRDLAWGCYILSSGVALTVAILPFIEVRAEKTFRELPKQLVQSPYALGCFRFYTIRKITLPICKGEIVSGAMLGGYYAMRATTPLIFTGVAVCSGLPARLTTSVMALPMHLYLLVTQGATPMDMTCGTAFVVMALTSFSSLLTTIYARGSQKKWNIS